MFIMNNIFSSFEPFFFFKVNSLYLFLCLMTYYMVSTYYFKSMHFYCEFIKYGFWLKTSSKAQSLYFCIFWVIFYVNIYGLYPWFLSFTAHLSVNFTIGLSFWVMGFFWQMSKCAWGVVVHMTPKGSPFFLIFLLVLIETVSKMVQPITLSMRLTANMIAGHIILDLISNYIFLFSGLMMWATHTLYLMIFFMEIVVSLIQSYIFSYLLFMYMEI